MNRITPLAETKDTVTLSRADYRTLVDAADEAGDVAAVRAHRTHEERVGWEAARRDYLSADEARRLLAGQTAVRVWREKRKMQQQALAAAAGIAPSYLAEIESGRKSGTLRVLRALATALDVSVETLLPPVGDE
jgi:ribosome-binding protein aMBF1 (putative translation factor)